jgi:hypothetical protein
MQEVSRIYKRVCIIIAALALIITTGSTYSVSAYAGAIDNFAVHDTDITVLGNMRIEPETVRKIAALHPRFAFVIKGYLQAKPIHTYSKLVTTPVELSPEDIEELLKPQTETTEFRNAFKKRAGQATVKSLREGRPTVTYIITADVSPIDPNQGTYRLVVAHPAPTDPLYNQLELNLVKSQKTGEWIVNSWQVK